MTYDYFQNAFVILFDHKNKGPDVFFAIFACMVTAS